MTDVIEAGDVGYYYCLGGVQIDVWRDTAGDWWARALGRLFGPCETERRVRRQVEEFLFVRH